MAQFSLHRNPNSKSKSKSKSAIPYLLDVQADLLSKLETRVVIPLFRHKSTRIKPLTRLTPEIEIQGEKYVLMVPQLAGISTKNLGPGVRDLSRYRNDIIAALDLLITGF